MKFLDKVYVANFFSMYSEATLFAWGQNLLRTL